MIDKEDLLNRAMAAYFRAPPEGLEVRQQPGRAESGVAKVAGKRYVVLRNVHGILKVYRVRNDGMLKRLKRWPTELENR